MLSSICTSSRSSHNHTWSAVVLMSMFTWAERFPNFDPFHFFFCDWNSATSGSNLSSFRFFYSRHFLHHANECDEKNQQAISRGKFGQTGHAWKTTRPALTVIYPHWHWNKSAKMAEKEGGKIKLIINWCISVFKAATGQVWVYLHEEFVCNLELFVRRRTKWRRVIQFLQKQ